MERKDCVIQSQRVVCKELSKENNLSLHALRYWIMKFNREKNKTNETVKFKPLTLGNSSNFETSVTVNPIKITVGQSVIELTKGFDEEAFDRVVHILS